MPNNYKKMTPEQRKRWTEYQKEYFRKNCKSYSIKFNKQTDKEIIDYITTHGPITILVRNLIREKIDKGE